MEGDAGQLISFIINSISCPPFEATRYFRNSRGGEKCVQTLKQTLCRRLLKFVKKLKSVPRWGSKVEVGLESGRGCHN